MNESKLSASLAEAQERHNRRTSIRYTIDTEFFANLPEIVSRYFQSFSSRTVSGWYRGVAEMGTAITIVGTLADLQTITNLALDIKTTNKQDNVLVTYDPVTRLDI